MVGGLMVGGLMVGGLFVVPNGCLLSLLRLCCRVNAFLNN